MRYFSFDPDQGMLFHDNEFQAKTYCEEYMKEMRLDSLVYNGEWPLDADSVCWGQVKEKSTAVNVVEDEFCDYELRQV